MCLKENINSFDYVVIFPDERLVDMPKEIMKINKNTTTCDLVFLFLCIFKFTFSLKNTWLLQYIYTIALLRYTVCVNLVTHGRIWLHTGTVPATEKCENIHKDGFHDNADLGLQYARKKVEIMQTSVAAATSAALKSKKRKRLEDGKSARATVLYDVQTRYTEINVLIWGFVIVK